MRRTGLNLTHEHESTASNIMAKPKHSSRNVSVPAASAKLVLDKPSIQIKVSTRARAMRVSVYAGGEVRVTVPHKTSQSAIDRFIAKYSEWIAKQLKRVEGRKVIVGKKALIKEYKARAQMIAEERCSQLAKVYGVRYGKITIRAQKSRWGSCSRLGNLSFNYKIALLSAPLVDYILVHEICHLIAFDHSKRFWTAVERTVPDHLKLRKALRSLAFRFV